MSVKTRLVVANWKNNGTLADAHVLALGVRNATEHFANISVVLCPPLLWLSEVRGIISADMKHLALGVQDLSSQPVGAHTGEVAAELVATLAQYAIIGHSEWLREHNPTLEQLHDKLHAALANRLTPIICVGEESQSSTSKNQLKRRLESLLRYASPAQRSKCVIAYEPVWAISQGPHQAVRAATPQYVAEVVAALRTAVPSTTRVLYGGSVSAKNAAEFVTAPGVDGVLVGGASLLLREFTTLVKNVALA